MHKALHLSLYENTIYGEWKKKEFEEELGTEELDAQHYAPCTLNCMYVFYCLLLWTVNAYFIWIVTLWYLWMNLENINATYFDKQQVF